MKKNLRKIGFILALGAVSFTMTNCGGMTAEEAAALEAEMTEKANAMVDEAAAHTEEAVETAEEAVEEHKCGEDGKCADGHAAEAVEGAVETAGEHVDAAVETAGEHVDAAVETVEEHVGH